jgi:hypothetical protein
LVVEHKHNQVTDAADAHQRIVQLLRGPGAMLDVTPETDGGELLIWLGTTNPDRLVLVEVMDGFTSSRLFEREDGSLCDVATIYWKHEPPPTLVPGKDGRNGS